MMSLKIMSFINMATNELQKATADLLERRLKVKRDWEQNDKVWIDGSCFSFCWNKIWRWLDLGSMLGLLMKHEIVKDEEDFFLINNTNKSPRERANNLLAIVRAGGDFSFYLLYMCIRDDSGNPLGHRDAVTELVTYARKKRIQPPDWVLRDDLGIQGGREQRGDDSTISDSGKLAPLQCTEENTGPLVSQSRQPPRAMVTGQRDPTHQLSVPGRHPEAQPPSSIIQEKLVNPLPSSLSGRQPLQSPPGPVSSRVHLQGSATANNSRAMRGDTVERDKSGHPVGEDVSRDGERGGKKQLQPQSNSGAAQVGLTPGMIQTMVRQGSFQELVSRSQEGVDIEFAPAEACQNKDDFLQTVFKFFAACINTRDEIQIGVLIAGVSDEPPYNQVELRFKPDVVEKNLNKVLQRTVFVRDGDKERPLNDEEAKQLTLQFFMPTTAISDKQASRGSKIPVALCIVEPMVPMCGCSLYTVCTMFRRHEVLKRDDGDYRQIEKPARIRELQKKLEAHLTSWNN